MLWLIVFAAPASKEIKGLEWRGAAIGTASWSGVLLRDVLQAAGLDAEDASISHVQVCFLNAVSRIGLIFGTRKIQFDTIDCNLFFLRNLSRYIYASTCRRAKIYSEVSLGWNTL